MVLDPDEPDAMALAERAQAAAERQQVDAWLEEARTEFARGGLTAAAVLADRALVFDQTLPEAQAIKRAVHDARRRLAEEGERLRAGAESVAPAERQLAAGPQIQSVQPRREETRFWFQPAMARRLGYLAWALAGVLVLAGGVAITRWWNVPPQTQRDAGKSPLPPVASVAPQPPAVVESGSTTSAPEGAVGGDATAPPRATKAAAGPSAARAGSPAPVSGTRGAPVIEAPAANSRQALQVACDRGDAARCYDLGVSYQTAKGGQQDQVRATALFQGACESGLAQGCHALGVAYSRGFGVQPDERRAATLYQQACDGGYASGCVNAGLGHLRGRSGVKDETRAAALLQRGCDLGDGGGCANLGRLYEFGQGVQKDEARAAALYQRGCAAANASACTSFGWMYFRGVGIEKDEARAVTLFRRACDNGHAPGCNDLGVAYAEGRGVPKDENRAAELYQQACDKDNPLACVKLGFMYRRGEPVPRDDARAATLFQRACDGGNPVGCLNVGFAYANGRGVPRDESRAVALYQRSCDAGTADACTRVATMYEQGRGVAKDAARAAAMYARGRDLIGKGSTDAAPSATTPATTSTDGNGQRPLQAPGGVRPAPAPTVPLRVGGAIPSPSKIKDVRPDYPTAALYARVQGMVIIEVTLGADGKVAQTKILRSIPLLDGAAEDAVKQWQYSPTVVDGKAVPVVLTATLNFSLPEPKPAPAAKETAPVR
jgi:TonB family protein